MCHEEERKEGGRNGRGLYIVGGRACLLDFGLSHHIVHPSKEVNLNR